MRILLATILVTIAFNANAEEIFPKACTPIVIKDNTITLSTEEPAVVMMHNLASNDLWITHISKKSASAGWSSHLQPGNWSALALNSQEFELSCIESKPGHEQQIPCSDVIAVCKWSPVVMPEKTSGTFWAGENMALSALKAYIERRGFVLNTSKSHGES